MRVPPKKIRRHRPPDEIIIEQTHDAKVIEAMIHKAAGAAPAISSFNCECVLIAYSGDDPVGMAALETEVDAALIRALFVVDRMQRRGIGARLTSALRRAAHTRGARELYACVPPGLARFFARLGFHETNIAEFNEVFRHASMLQRMKPSHSGPCSSARVMGMGAPEACLLMCLDLPQDDFLRGI